MYAVHASRRRVLVYFVIELPVLCDTLVYSHYTVGEFTRAWHGKKHRIELLVPSHDSRVDK
jgi:hypothetical protein